MKYGNFYIALIMLMFFQNIGTADIIYVNDGRKLKGVVVSENSYSYMIEINGVPERFFKDQIVSIEKEEVKEDIKQSSLTEQLIKEGYLSDIDLYHNEEMTENKKESIRYFLEVLGVVRLLKQNKEKALEKVPTENLEEFSVLFDIDKLIERIIPIYARYYTSKDIDVIITFYESEAGQKMKTSAPILVKEITKMMADYFKEVFDSFDAKG